MYAVNYLNEKIHKYCSLFIDIFFRRNIITILLSFFVSLFFKIVRPIVNISVLRWDLGSRIGHMACESDIYLSEKVWGIKRQNSSKVFCLYYLPGENFIGDKPIIPNNYIFSRLKKKIPGLRYSRILQWVQWWNEKLFQEKTKHAFYPYPTYVDRHLVIPRTNSHFTISKKEKKYSELKLKKLGIDVAKPTILFFNRDESYIKSYLNCNNDHINDHRNSAIYSYFRMSNYFHNLGYNCIRLGRFTQEKITNLSYVLDLSALPIDELLEFYLYSVAKFTVSDQTGANMIPGLFRKPRVIVNEPNLLSYVSPEGYFQPLFGCIIIFKKVHCLKNNKLLTVSDLKERNLLRSFIQNESIPDCIKLINNTPEEILKASLEMHKRLNNEWIETNEDIFLQNKFWEHVGVMRNQKFLEVYPKVCSTFLKSNKWLLS